LGLSRAFQWFGASASARAVGEWREEGAMAVILVGYCCGL